MRREVTGGWQYVRGVLEAASRHSRGLQYVALVTPEGLPLVEDLPGVEVMVMHFPNRVRTLRILIEHASLPRFVRRHRLDCLHCFIGTAPRGLPSAVALTVYDLLVIHRPGEFNLIKRVYLQREVAASIRGVDAVLPISRATGRDVVSRVGVNPSVVTTILPVVDRAWAPSNPRETAALRERLGLPAEFWLCVSAWLPYKNHERLFQALAMIQERGLSPWPLVLRGPESAIVEKRAAAYGVSNLVRVVPRLDQRDLGALYSAASGCVFPSLFEGAGLPVLEAMACGAPVIASDIPTNREFTSLYADLFDPEDVEAIANAMTRLQHQPPDRIALRRVASDLLNPMRPEHVAMALQTAYESARMHWTKRGVVQLASEQ